MKSVPVHLLVESQEQVVTVELVNGSSYRGKLLRVEDNMNVQLTDVIVTSREGERSHSDAVFLRGSQICMFQLPDVLRFAPTLQPELAKKAREQAKAQRQAARNRSRLNKPPRKQLKTN